MFYVALFGTGKVRRKFDLTNQYFGSLSDFEVAEPVYTWKGVADFKNEVK